MSWFPDLHVVPTGGLQLWWYGQVEWAHPQTLEKVLRCHQWWTRLGNPQDLQWCAGGMGPSHIVLSGPRMVCKTLAVLCRSKMSPRPLADCAGESGIATLWPCSWGGQSLFPWRSHRQAAGRVWVLPPPQPTTVCSRSVCGQWYLSSGCIRMCSCPSAQGAGLLLMAASLAPVAGQE